MKPEKKGWKAYSLMTIIRYWIFQGMFYMNWIERLHRLVLEILFFLIIYLSLSQYFVHGIIASILIGHTLNAILNGHVIAMCVHDLFWFSLYKDRQKFLYYIEECRLRMVRKSPNYVSGAVFFGSLTFGSFKATSDLDIRFIPEDGFWNAFRTAHLVFVERWHALWAGFPLDAYMFRTKAEVYKKMDVESETPVIVYRNGKRLEKIFSKLILFENFKENFLK